MDRTRDPCAPAEKEDFEFHPPGTVCGIGSTAAAPASTAKLPDSPPTTMLIGVRRLSHTV